MIKFSEGKKTIWDTTIDPIDYPIEIRNIFFKLFIKERKKFANWIGSIAYKNFENIEDLIKLPLSRDPYISSLFKNILILNILQSKQLRKKIKTIIFDSKSTALTFLNTIKNHKIKIVIKNTNNQTLRIFKSFIFSFLTFFFIKIINKKFYFDKKKIILFNTHLSCENQIKDHVFPGLNKILKKKRIKDYYFVPDFLITKKIINFYKNLKFMAKQNYLFKENYVSFNEFFLCFFSTLFHNHQIRNKYYYSKTLDCSLIIQDEFKSKISFYSEFQSRLKLIFIKNLKKNNINLKKSIGRFENQSVDKAWFYGMRTHYPDTKIYGFQSFLYYPHFLNQSPTLAEDKLKLVPNKIIVTNKIAKSKRREFNKKANIILGPSLGKQEIFKKIRMFKKYKFVITLCGVKSVDEKILSWLIYSFQKDKNFEIIIKPHPTMSLNKINNFKSKLLEGRYIIVKENIHSILEKTEILISSGPTGVTFESLVYGCKLLYLIFDPNDVLMFKNIPNKKRDYILIKNKEELFRYIQILKKTKINKNENNLKKLFFTKINKKNLKLFY